MWPFRNRQIESEPAPDPIQQLETQMLGAISALSDQVNKFVRWSYRSQKTQTEGLQALQEQFAVLRQDRESATHRLQRQVDQLTMELIAWLDDLDALTSSLSPQSIYDERLLERWSTRIVAQLADVGMEECAVQGKPFNPRLAEALGTTSEWSGENSPVAYQVVQVLRRGFLQHGEVYRKAQVIVYNKGQELSEENTILC